MIAISQVTLDLHPSTAACLTILYIILFYNKSPTQIQTNLICFLFSEADMLLLSHCLVIRQKLLIKTNY